MFEQKIFRKNRGKSVYTSSDRRSRAFPTGILKKPYENIKLKRKDLNFNDCPLMKRCMDSLCIYIYDIAFSNLID